MKYVAGDDHRLHAPSGEVYGGELVAPFESPERWDNVVAALEADGSFQRLPPDRIDADALHRVHDDRYLEFLETAWGQWREAGYAGDVIPTCFPARRMGQREPADIDGRVGFFSFAAETAITPGTWRAALASAAVARTGQRLVSGGEPSAFALCRPPGHHAGRDYFGGYCFLNNVAVAAQGLLDDGAERVAILDVDFHHGNGTQDIFFERGDVFFASLHGDPRHEFPYFLGHADEVGRGAGEGCTANYPLAPGAGFATWFEALVEAGCRIAGFGPDALVVSLGVDTFVDDPISSFELRSNDFTTYGRHIGGLGLPTLYCLEGGYAVAELGTNTRNVLVGHHEGAS